MDKTAGPKMSSLQDYEPSDYLDFLRIRSLLRGTIFLIESIDADTAERICFEIEEAHVSGVKKLNFVISSPGGDVFSGLAIYDQLEDYKKKGGYVTTETRGYAASMGGIILQAGNERLINKNAKVLIHEVSQWSDDLETVSSAEEKAVEMRKVNSQLIKILASRSGQPRKKIEKLIKKKDCWLSAAEAKKLNFVDKII